MVYPDLNEIKYSKKNFKPSVPIRILSSVIDYFIFTPVVSFFVIVFFKEGVDLYRDFPQSVDGQFAIALVGFFFLIATTLLQALFIVFHSGTPGQFFLKLEIEFKNKNYPVFLQAWVRQIGFTFSFLMLGVPFLRILSDQNGQGFYEKMTDSEVRSKWPIDQKSYFHPKSIEIDRKFWSASLATLNVFFIALFALVLIKNYNTVLTSPVAYATWKARSKFKECQEFQKLNASERLRYMIAMNLVGTYSDKCLNQEADFVLWKNFTDDKSLAYFAKFITSQKNDFEKKYLKQACEIKKSEGCYWAQVFENSNFQNLLTHSNYGDNILARVLTYEMNPELAETQKADLLTQIKTEASFKSVRKYLILESLLERKEDFASSSLQASKNKNRLPASVSKNLSLNMKNKIKNSKTLSEDDILKWIDDL